MTATQESLSLARDLLVNWFWTVEATGPEPNRRDVTLTAPGDLVPMVVALRVKRLGYLSAITGCDPGPDTGQLEVLYHFCAGEAVIPLRLYLPDDWPEGVYPLRKDVDPRLALAGE